MAAGGVVSDGTQLSYHVVDFKGFYFQPAPSFSHKKMPHSLSAARVPPSLYAHVDVGSEVLDQYSNGWSSPCDALAGPPMVDAALMRRRPPCGPSMYSSPLFAWQRA